MRAYFAFVSTCFFHDCKLTERNVHANLPGQIVVLFDIVKQVLRQVHFFKFFHEQL